MHILNLLDDDHGHCSFPVMGNGQMNSELLFSEFLLQVLLQRIHMKKRLPLLVLQHLYFPEGDSFDSCTQGFGKSLLCCKESRQSRCGLPTDLDFTFKIGRASCRE